MAGLWIRALYRIPLVVTLHSMEPLRPWKADQLGTGYLLSTWIEKTTVEAADRVIAVSGKMREDILAHFRVDPAKVVVIHNGIDPERFRPTAERDALDRLGVRTPYVLFVGRITDQKGIFHLLEAAKLLPAGVQVVLCASAPDTPEIEARLRRAMPGHPNVLWINEMVPREVVIQLMSHAAVFTGVLENPALGRSMGRAGRRRVEERFTWARVAERTEQAYADAAAEFERASAGD